MKPEIKVRLKSEVTQEDFCFRTFGMMGGFVMSVTPFDIDHMKQNVQVAVYDPDVDGSGAYMIPTKQLDEDGSDMASYAYYPDNINELWEIVE